MNLLHWAHSSVNVGLRPNDSQGPGWHRGFFLPVSLVCNRPSLTSKSPFCDGSIRFHPKHTVAVDGMHRRAMHLSFVLQVPRRISAASRNAAGIRAAAVGPAGVPDVDFVRSLVINGRGRPPCTHGLCHGVSEPRIHYLARSLLVATSASSA